MDRLVGLSKLMSLVLRHKPTEFGVVLDGEGYTPISDLVDAIRTQRADVSLEDIRVVVERVDPRKQRFSIAGDDIRANYGHSLAEKIRRHPTRPPDLLLHGTGESTVGAILESGLKPMSRQYVHLTVDRSLALKVGSRHGRPRLINVDAERAYAAGIPFYKANRSFWLADAVPAEYLTLL